MLGREIWHNTSRNNGQPHSCSLGMWTLVNGASDSLQVDQSGYPVPDRTRVPERRTSNILWLLALIVLCAAILLALLPGGCSVGGEGFFREEVVPGAFAFLADLEKQPIESLPSDVFNYETIALQEIPTMPQAAEAVYKPWDMDISLATPVRIYANVEAFPSSAQAEARKTELLEGYPADRRDELLGGVTPAKVGMTNQMDAWIASWTHGQFCVYVKVFFDRPVPADGSAKSVLEPQGMYLSRLIDLYQRTGQQGVAARDTLEKAGLAPELSTGPMMAPELGGQ